MYLAELLKQTSLHNHLVILFGGVAAADSTVELVGQYLIDLDVFLPVSSQHQLGHIDTFIKSLAMQ